MTSKSKIESNSCDVLEIVDLDDEPNESCSEPAPTNHTKENQISKRDEVLQPNIVDVKRNAEQNSVPKTAVGPDKKNGKSIKINSAAEAELMFKQKEPKILTGDETIHRNSRGLFQCNGCAHMSKYKQNIKVHQRLHREENARRYKCNQCDYGSPIEKDVDKHIEIHAEQKLIGIVPNRSDGTYKCIHCDFKFTKWRYLAMHYLQSHNQYYRLFTCVFCLRGYRQTHKLEGQPFKCFSHQFETFATEAPVN